MPQPVVGDLHVALLGQLAERPRTVPSLSDVGGLERRDGEVTLALAELSQAGLAAREGALWKLTDLGRRAVDTHRHRRVEQPDDELVGAGGVGFHA